MKMGATYWINEILPEYKGAIEKWKSIPLTERKSIELLAGATDMLYPGERSCSPELVGYGRCIHQ